MILIMDSIDSGEFDLLCRFLAQALLVLPVLSGPPDRQI